MYNSSASTTLDIYLHQISWWPPFLDPLHGAVRGLDPCTRQKIPKKFFRNPLTWYMFGMTLGARGEPCVMTGPVVAWLSLMASHRMAKVGRSSGSRCQQPVKVSGSWHAGDSWIFIFFEQLKDRKTSVKKDTRWQVLRKFREIFFYLWQSCKNLCSKAHIRNKKYT